MSLFKFTASIPGMRAIYRALYCYDRPGLEKEVFGLKFKNPVGLAAGFDKDGKYINVLPLLGFGFIEIGTVTPKPQPGNPKPRLFRLKKSSGLINRMGFNNEGCDALAERLRKMKPTDCVVGANIGKNKVTPNEKAVDDYVYCFEKLFDLVDYFVVNVSSPNTPGLRELQDKEPLTHLLSTLQKLNIAKPEPKPILLKIAPDLTHEQIDDIVDIVKDTGIAGLIGTNTTISREGLKESKDVVDEIGAGGLSGAPVRERSTEVLKEISDKAHRSFPVIGVGGIFNGQDAYEKIEAGADLVQVYTGFIYEGPTCVKRIIKGLSSQ